MKTYAPAYYKEFHCTADRCRHTCCAGWDVDIDEESLGKYKAMTGEFAGRLKKCIDFGKDPHFILTPEERCPLLNENNLCELILHEGEEALCQICRDHPRFRNYWTDRIEVGLGMACEEAARLILSQKEPFRLEVIEEDDTADPEGLPEDEQYLMQVREDLLEEAAAVESAPLARLLEYLIYRHIADALYDDRLEERIAFIRDTFYELAGRWTDGKPESLTEIVRSWSAEYEYDTDKIRDLLDTKYK